MDEERMEVFDLKVPSVNLIIPCEHYQFHKWVKRQMITTQYSSQHHR